MWSPVYINLAQGTVGTAQIVNSPTCSNLRTIKMSTLFETELSDGNQGHCAIPRNVCSPQNF